MCEPRFFVDSCNCPSFIDLIQCVQYWHYAASSSLTLETPTPIHDDASLYYINSLHSYSTTRSNLHPLFTFFLLFYALLTIVLSFSKNAQDTFLELSSDVVCVNQINLCFSSALPTLVATSGPTSLRFSTYSTAFMPVNILTLSLSF